MTGTISLGAGLPAIQNSYDINGPGASTLTVDGGNQAGTVFTVKATVTSTINGLTIQAGILAGPCLIISQIASAD